MIDFVAFYELPLEGWLVFAGFTVAVLAVGALAAWLND